jgi:hypothetical protein
LIESQNINDSAIMDSYDDGSSEEEEEEKKVEKPVKLNKR